MNFEDLYEIDDPIEKEAETIKFYTTEIKVDKWIKSFPTSVIRFADRKEYRKNNKLHRLNGPAIEYHNTQKNTTGAKIYYIDGDQIEYNPYNMINIRDGFIVIKEDDVLVIYD